MHTDDIGFVIMQIGNAELDKLYDSSISKAIEDSGLKPIRIDKHNDGGLLKSEIIRNIENALIIIADLTNERPNCYLEIGYAMGLDKFNNLILTAREDHFHDSPKYNKKGPKIHFDLSGYDIYFWNPDNPEQFKKDLTEKIKRRLVRIRPKNVKNKPEFWNEDWLTDKREYVESQIKKLGINGFMEIRSTVLNGDLNISQSDILIKAKDSFIDNFGWPIGIIINEGTYKPIPKTDGIISDIYNDVDKTYDFSYFKKNGQIYTVTSHFEDARNENLIIVPTRIIRVTEVFMFLARYYTNVGLSINDSFEVIFRHTGIKGRNLKEGFHYFSRIQRISNENEVEVSLEISIKDIENNLVELVSKVINPLLILFDFYKIEKSVIENYVNDFINKNK